MSLNDEERKTMVGLEIEKADRFLKQADMMTDMESGGQFVPLFRDEIKIAIQKMLEHY